jgi:hypothetical protein
MAGAASASPMLPAEKYANNVREQWTTKIIEQKI